MSEKCISVLLIEDNPGDVRLIQEILEEEASAQFQLAYATALEAGLERLGQGGIDVTLLDLSLPDSHGIDTFNRVQAHSPEVPIVVLTGLNDQAIAAQTLRAGGQDYLNKGALNLCILDQSLRHAIERKQADKSDDASHAVEAADLVHDQFLAVLGDELRTPLTSVLATVSTLTREPTTWADLLPGLAMIRRDVAVERQLVDEVLAYARVAIRGVAFRPIDSEVIAKRAIAGLKSSIDQARAVVTHDLLPSLWADGSQMGQLFQILIRNAIKYRGEGPPRIHLAAERQSDEWVFSVRDNGIGFDSRQGERIFIIFQRLNDQDEYPGTGIGLAICKKIVERHGGRIWAESEPGRGSCFFFTIPANADDEP